MKRGPWSRFIENYDVTKEHFIKREAFGTCVITQVVP